MTRVSVNGTVTSNGIFVRLQTAERTARDVETVASDVVDAVIGVSHGLHSCR